MFSLPTRKFPVGVPKATLTFWRAVSRWIQLLEEPSLKERAQVLNCCCLGLGYCMPSLRPVSPSEGEKNKRKQAVVVSAALGWMCGAPDAF